ncbi:MAG: HAMP domain-containing protein [Actinobacteria bacterium]|nr:HAMP domain-containing protein [Actinomycetota bacterium]
MFESYLAVPFHFTIEFVGFMVTAGAALLIPTRPSLIPGRAVSRIVAALGFATLAAAQVAHGASFVPLDGDPDWALVRAAGLVLVLLGLMGGGRSAPAAGAFVTADAPMLFAPAGSAALLAGWSLMVAAREGRATTRRLALAAFLIGVSEAVTAFVPDARFGQGVTEPLIYMSHGARLAGYVALVAWLWTGVRVSIRTRFVAAFTGLLMVVVLALSGTLTGVLADNVQDEELARLESQVTNQIQSVESDADQLLEQTEFVGGLAAVRSAVAAGSGMGQLARELAEGTLGTLFGEFDVALITTKTGRLLGVAGTEPVANAREKRDGPKPLGDSKVQRLLGSPVLIDVIDPAFERTSSIDRVDPTALAALAAVEVRTPGSSKTAGILLLGRWIDYLTIEGITNLVKPARATLIGNGTAVAGTLPASVMSELVTPAIEDQVESGNTVSMRQAFEKGAFFTAFGPLTTSNETPVGALALSSPDRVIAQTREDVTRTLFLVAMGIGFVALALAWLSGRRISRPIQRLTQTAMAVREGHLDAKADVGGSDEVGRLGDTFNEMTDALMSMTTNLREAALEEGRLRSRIEAIIQSMADGLVAVDHEKRILAFNAEAELLTGVKASKAVGRPVDEVIAVLDGQGEPSTLPIFELTEGSIGGVFLVRASGSPVPVAVTSAVLRGEDGTIAGGVAVIRDMSQEHDFERMKSEFLSNISHELRTPLTPIKGYAELMGRKGLSYERTQHFSKGILESTGRLERIVELLVDFSAMEAGRLAPKRSRVDIRALIERLGESWPERSPGHEFVIEAPESLPAVVGDERLLKRTIEEMIDNAVKFSPGGGAISVSARRVASNGSEGRGAVEIVVSDQGIGISSEDLPRIFSDFHQIDGSETRTYGGLGLGLAFVRRIVEAHSGTIEVTSEPEQGSTFTITLPELEEG